MQNTITARHYPICSGIIVAGTVAYHSKGPKWDVRIACDTGYLKINKKGAVSTFQMPCTSHSLQRDVQHKLPDL